MAIMWDKYHVGVHKYGTLFIGHGELKSNGLIKWDSKSGDRTEEIVRIVMQKMRVEMKKKNIPDKPYFGYNIKGCGKLVYIKDGWDISVKPSPVQKKNNKKKDF